MIDFLMTERLKELLFLIILVLIILRVGGISFLMRLFLRICKVDFYDGKIKEYNRDRFDAQMYRFLNGINIVNMNDADVIEKGLKTGVFRRSSFWLTSFFGPLGVRRIMGFEIIFSVLIFTVSVGCGVFMLVEKPDYKRNYAVYNVSDDRKLLISLNEIYDKKMNRHLNEADCRALSAENGEDYKSACSYLTTESKVKRNELEDAIREAKGNILVYLSISFVFLAVGLLLLCGFASFIWLNKKVCDLKRLP